MKRALVSVSDKTNLVEFFRFFKECISKGIPMEAAGMFCKNREENKEREHRNFFNAIR